VRRSTFSVNGAPLELQEAYLPVIALAGNPAPRK
jgi:hypothetical protein